MTVAVNFSPRHWVDGLLGRLLPARCLVCNADGAGGRDLCADCMAGLPWLHGACPRCALPLADASGIECGHCQRRPPPLQATHAAFEYRAPLDGLLPRLKFHRNLGCARLLVTLMAEAAHEWPRPDALIPIPLHNARLRQRGYDQALELARPLARQLQLPLRADILQRQRPTSAQSRLDARARKRNLRGAFKVREVPLPTHVALVDDVMTTGATLHAAATALRRAGVQRVDAWVCARVP